VTGRWLCFARNEGLFSGCSPALCCLSLLLLFCSLSSAGPVATFALEGGGEITAELVRFSDNHFTLRHLEGNRREQLVPAANVRAVDFGKVPIELKPNGAIILPQDAEDCAPLWWAIDGRHFIILFQTCRLDTGTAGRSRVLKLQQEIRKQLEREDLDRARRRDLRLALAAAEAAFGRRLRFRQTLRVLGQDYPDDPVLRNFVADVWMLIGEEMREGRKRPPAPRGPRRPGNARE